MTTRPADPAISRLVNGVLLPGFNGSRVPDWLARALDGGLAGAVYFAHNVPDLATTRALSAALHDVRPDAIIASDEEGGDVTRVEARAGSSLPGNAALGVVDDTALTRRAAAALGRVQRAVGIDLDLAPSVDVNTDPLNPVIGVRAFGSDPNLVARHAAAFVDGLQSSGVAACAKHFPGHGDTDVDSHLDLPTLDVDLDVLRERDLVPFEAAITAGVRALLTAHLRIPAFGAAPATLNPAVTALARAELGFDGVIVTDALDMAAVSRDPGFAEAAVQAIQAGADLLCLGNPVHRDDEAAYRTARDALVEAVRTGRLSPNLLEAAGQRVAALVAWLASVRVSVPDHAGLTGATEELAAVGREAAGRAVRVIGDVRLAGTPCIVDLRLRMNQAAGRNAHHVQRELVAALPGSVWVEPVGDPDFAVASIVSAAAGRPMVVIVREPHGDAREAALLEAVRLARPDLVVAHTGWPHQVDALGERAVLTYGAGRASARAGAERLAGVVAG